MGEAIIVTDAVRIPLSALTVHAVRASGPGGQNVNKVATKVELRVDLAAVEGCLAPAAPVFAVSPVTASTPTGGWW
jgi:protein subunit release factor B